MDYCPPGSSVRGILQARILKWVAFLSPGDLPNPGIDPGSPTLQADALPSEPPGKPQNSMYLYMVQVYYCMFIGKMVLYSRLRKL